jgi:hypothetical protein
VRHQLKPLAHIGWQSPKKEAILTIAEHDRWLLHNRPRDVIGSQEADNPMHLSCHHGINGELASIATVRVPREYA